MINDMTARNKKTNLSALTAALFAGLAGVLPAAAQYDQTINVEGKYTPQIIRLDRINTFPRQERFPLESAPLPYDATGLVTPFDPVLSLMPPTGWKDTRPYFSDRGYLELEAGSWLDASLSAGYRFMNSRSMKAGVRFQHNSTSLWKPFAGESDVPRKRYDEMLGFYMTHDVNGKGMLDASLDYHLGYFNYYGTMALGTPTQTLNDFAARVGWESPSRADDISWNASGAVRYFGYRRFLSTDHSIDGEILPDHTDFSGTKETNITLRGGLLFPTSGKSAVGADLSADLYLYGGGKHVVSDKYDNFAVVSTTADITPSSMGLITLKPYYRFSVANLNLRLGATLDIAANAGPENDRYGVFHIAPDVRLDYNAGPVALYLKAAGGSRPHTLAGSAALDYYNTPLLTNTTPVYTPLDGAFGIGFGPFSGFSAGLDFAFRLSRGEYLSGWYMATLCPLWQSFPYDEGTTRLLDLNQEQRVNLHGYSVGLRLGYDAGKIFRINGNVNYQPQGTEKGYFNGLDRPRWVARVEATTNPWNTLTLGLAYDYRGVRHSYLGGYGENTTNFAEPVVLSKRLPDVTDLSFTASYAFSRRFSVRIGAANLLNRKIEWLPAQPLPGIRITAGITYIFE